MEILYKWVIGAGGVRVYVFPLKKRARFRFLTEEDCINAVFFNPNDASSRFFHKAKPFLKAKNERFGGFCPECCQKNVLKIQPKY